MEVEDDNEEEARVRNDFGDEEFVVTKKRKTRTPSSTKNASTTKQKRTSKALRTESTEYPYLPAPSRLEGKEIIQKLYPTSDPFTVKFLDNVSDYFLALSMLTYAGLPGGVGFLPEINMGSEEKAEEAEEAKAAGVQGEVDEVREEKTSKDLNDGRNVGKKVISFRT